MYRGQLTPAQVAEGVNAASRNATRLAGDAKLLLENERFPSAASIAVLAIEEAGKTSILRALAVANDDDEIKKEWKAYRSHTNKNVQWILPKLVAEGARKLDDLRSIFDRDSDHPFLLNNLKQLGFYTDCLGEAHWTEPAETVNEQIAKMLVEVAQILSVKSEISEREMELWVEYVSPVWKKNYNLMKQALIDWYSALQNEGLYPEGVNKMEQFIRDGV